MIKEDHLLACTTKMFEILVALLHQLGQTLTSRETTWIVRTAQVHLSFRTHILAAIRLFTCQRASPSHTNHPSDSSVGAWRQNLLQTPVATFVTVVVPPLGEADISVSFARVNRSKRSFSTASISRLKRAEATQNPEPIDRFRTVRTTINFWVLRSAAFECHRQALRLKHHNR